MSEEQDENKGRVLKQQSEDDKSFAEAVRRAAQHSEPAKAPWETGQNTYTPPTQTPKQIRDAQPGYTPPQQTTNQSYASPRTTFVHTAPAEDFQVADPDGKSNTLRIIGWIAAAIIAVGLVIYGLVPPKLSAPTSFGQYISPDSRFSCDIPAGWTVSSNPAPSTEDDAIGGALFKDGPAKIDITTDTVSDLKSAILIDSTAALPDDFTKDPTPVLHKMQKGSVAVMIKNYKEHRPQQQDTALGSALVSEFTGIGGYFGLGGPIRGYRVSLSDGQSTFEVVLQCPQSDWDALEPAFSHVIASFAPVAGSGPSAPTPSTDFGSAGKPVQSNPSDTQAPSNGIPAIPSVNYGMGGDTAQ